jgi:hypothetical protein
MKKREVSPSDPAKVDVKLDLVKPRHKFAPFTHVERKQRRDEV